MRKNYQIAEGNPAFGQAAAGEAVKDRRDSKAHRNNILSKDFVEIGVSCYDKNGTYDREQVL